jgi:hypothetical protein
MPWLHGVLVYHERELGLLAPARGQTPRARTTIAQGLPDAKQHGHAYMDQVFASGSSQTSIRWLECSIVVGIA